MTFLIYLLLYEYFCKTSQTLKILFNFFNEKMKPKGFLDFLCSCYNQEITSISISFLLHNDNSCLRKFLSFFRNWAAIPYAWEQVAKASQVHGKLEPLGGVYMQISGLLQTLMIIYKEFKLFFCTYVWKFGHKLHVSEINKMMSDLL